MTRHKIYHFTLITLPLLHYLTKITVQNIDISYAIYTVKYGVFEQGSHTEGGSCG